MGVTPGKEHISIYLYPETLKKVKELFREDDCRSQSEFIEKAIRFYVGYLTAEDKSSFLPTIFLSNMKAIFDESDNRHSEILFKMAVEMAIIMNLLAAGYHLDEKRLDELRGSCVKEVQRLNGHFTFKDAVAWQKKRK